ncbi:C40 family peptidase [Gelidibacter salicanalis]|uniref:C40 family peptidase n=1 Tax=Gelidibacter salicanalis TaxID=291193 RepID=A0A934KKJ8_9FLAO|nr:C40 family peptidase [Gelidibacter salicanalis]MBJ7880777.1 C40 family peptidase [Gelidibacter salicanalis]
MKKIALILLLLVAFSSCKSPKRIVTTKSKASKIDSRSTSSASVNPVAENVLDYAMKFEGVKYKYGGTTKKGMDCSGLIVTSFNSENISLPRTTGDLAVTGDWIDLKKVEKGDLLFFATQKNSRTVSHVGIVTEAREGNVEFIHASTSNGVMVSNLAEKYWYFAFVQARRVL